MRYLQGRIKVAYAQWIPKLLKGQEVWKLSETARETMGWKLQSPGGIFYRLQIL
jgi:hypothetical protein